MAGWVGWEVLGPLPGKDGTTHKSHVDAQVGLVRLCSMPMLARNTMG